MPVVTLARHAMATRFEIVIHGPDPVSMRAAGEEALREIDRLEARLSLYRPTSEIAHVNARAGREPVRVTPEVFRLLERAAKLSRETGGAFDPTVAPLVKCWGFMDAEQRRPAKEEIEAARALVGMERVRLNAREFTVQFERPGMMLDLGAIGKGHAIEEAAQVLAEAGVTSALLHGGTSTVYGMGNPSDQDGWLVGLEPPPVSGRNPEPAAEPSAVALRDKALSVSGVWGRCFEAEGKTYGHVLDSRTGEPVCDSLMAAVVLPSATETDALSTALLAMGEQGFEVFARLRPEAEALLAFAKADRLVVRTQHLRVAWGEGGQQPV